MGLFSFLKKNPEIKGLIDQLSTTIIQVSGHECSELRHLWGRRLCDKDQILLFVEYSAFLIAATDRLAYEALNPDERSLVMNGVIDQIKAAFARQEHFGATEKERRDFYEKMVQERLENYGNCPSIMGKDPNNIIFTASKFLVGKFPPDIPGMSTAEILFATGKAITDSLAAILQTPPYRTLTSRS